MSSLEYYGINQQNIESKMAELFKGKEVVVSRADDYKADQHLLLTFKSNNNDICLNSVASAVTRALSLSRADLSDEGQYLIIRQK